MHQVPSPPYVGFRAALAKSSRRLNTSWYRNRTAALQRERDGYKGKKRGLDFGVNWCPTIIRTSARIRISLPSAERGRWILVLDSGGGRLLRARRLSEALSSACSAAISGDSDLWLPVGSRSVGLTQAQTTSLSLCFLFFLHSSAGRVSLSADSFAFFLSYFLCSIFFSLFL